ncbi:MAG: NADH-quinone oxidoreductase subunit C [Gammaproteobacteria bacterium]|nr:NADH-quinone oxidoreductase subunit C [Gammaproteobacteria bacterium]
MKTANKILLDSLYKACTGLFSEHHEFYDEVTLMVAPTELKILCLKLRDSVDLAFEQLIDVTVVDYLHYGKTEWQTEAASSQGFDRGVSSIDEISHYSPRFSVVYHLLSLKKNQRLRIKVFLEENHLDISSVTDIWPSANWFEREAFDLFGVNFIGHPDLRRILTDYEFVGHPFRKDFPVSGYVEARYDAEQGRVIYEPVSIEPRVLVPKVIRNDNSTDNGKK